MHNRSKKISLNDFEMSYSDAGQGLPIMLVHGFPFNSRMWQPQFASFMSQARVIAPDLRGHGESQNIPGPYSMELFADDLNALLDHLQIRQKIVLCGLSMGGYVAFAFYRKYAQRLAGLVLTATRAAADTPEARSGRDQAAALVREQGVAAFAAGKLPLSPTTLATRPDIVALVRSMMERTSKEGLLGALAGLKTRPDSTALLPTIRLPALILPGAEDPIVPLPEAQAMQAAIPGSHLKVIPGAGHLPNLENPQAFNQALEEFLIYLSSQAAS